MQFCSLVAFLAFFAAIEKKVNVRVDLSGVDSNDFALQWHQTKRISGIKVFPQILGADIIFRIFCYFLDLTSDWWGWSTDSFSLHCKTVADVLVMLKWNWNWIRLAWLVHNLFGARFLWIKFLKGFESFFHFLFGIVIL